MGQGLVTVMGESMSAIIYQLLRSSQSSEELTETHFVQNTRKKDQKPSPAPHPGLLQGDCE